MNTTPKTTNSIVCLPHQSQVYQYVTCKRHAIRDFSRNPEPPYAFGEKFCRKILPALRSHSRPSEKYPCQAEENVPSMGFPVQTFAHFSALFPFLRPQIEGSSASILPGGFGQSNALLCMTFVRLHVFQGASQEWQPPFQSRNIANYIP